jgi:hypothetical protein
MDMVVDDADVLHERVYAGRSHEAVPARLAEPAASAYADTIDATTSIQVFGTPSGTVTDMLHLQAGAGVPLSIKPHHLGGLTR